jgi:hypothetical protein
MLVESRLVAELAGRDGLRGVEQGEVQDTPWSMFMDGGETNTHRERLPNAIDIVPAAGDRHLMLHLRCLLWRAADRLSLI